DILVVIDQKREIIAIQEALSLNIPIISIIDTNCDPNLATIPILGNDDSIRSIKYIIKNISDSICLEISSILVKKLREKTGAGMMTCKNALQETNGNFDEAIKISRQKGLASADKKIDRKAIESLVNSYIHTGGKIGVLVEVNCETDFVARREEFQELVKNIA
ncbi:unnamed protein product, partial [Ascophyllum nodosum]